MNLFCLAARLGILAADTSILSLRNATNPLQDDWEEIVRVVEAGGAACGRCPCVKSAIVDALQCPLQDFDHIFVPHITKTAGTTLNAILSTHAVRHKLQIVQCYDDGMPLDLVDKDVDKFVVEDQHCRLSHKSRWGECLFDASR